MEFTVNLHQEPRVFKNYCKQNEMNWERCACDKNFSAPSHGFFLKPCTWKPVYDLVPLFSFNSLPECFADILLPSPAHIKGFKKI